MIGFSEGHTYKVGDKVWMLNFPLSRTDAYGSGFAPHGASRPR